MRELAVGLALFVRANVHDCPCFSAVDHDSNLATSEYVVLMHLSEAPDHQLRMSDVAARTALSPSRITRVVDDLARAGLVVKERCDSDAERTEPVERLRL